jgi:hypothetical protein
LTDGKCPIVAVLALGIADLFGSVPKDCRFEARSHMTNSAIKVGRHMVDFFTYDGITIMTGNTVARNIRVVVLGAGKRCGVMAVAAILSRLRGRMVCRHTGRSTIGTVTGFAFGISGYCTVIENHIRKTASGCVANDAIVSCGNVGYALWCVIFAGHGGTAVYVAGIATLAYNVRTGVVHIAACKIGPGG